MIKISKQADRLLLTYVPDRFSNVQWLDEKLRQDGDLLTEVKAVTGGAGDD